MRFSIGRIILLDPQRYLIDGKSDLDFTLFSVRNQFEVLLIYVFSFSPNLFEFPANFSRAFCIVKKVNKNYLKNVKMFQFCCLYLQSQIFTNQWK